MTRRSLSKGTKYGIRSVTADPSQWVAMSEKRLQAPLTDALPASRLVTPENITAD
jgi:hypothetical protein